MMKRLIPLVALAVLLGCASFQNTGGKLLSSTALTVDTAMKGWAAYVVAADVSTNDQQQVRSLYSQYQVDMLVAETVYLQSVVGNSNSEPANWSTATAALGKSSGLLLDAVSQLRQPRVGK